MSSDTVTPDVLDTGKDTAAWRTFREHSKDWGIPRGVYDGVLRSLDVVRRRDTGTFVLRLLARVLPRDKDALAWVALGDEDPYVLTAAQRKALLKFARGLGITETEPDEIVDEVAHLVGKPIAVKVIHTPVGPRATISLPESVKGEIVPAENGGAGYEELQHLHAAHAAGDDHDVARVNAAFRAQEMIQEGLRATRAGLLLAAEGCYQLHVTDGWHDLGYEKIGDFLAAPEIGIKRQVFYDLAGVWQRYIVEGGIEPGRLLEAEHSKLAIALTAIADGKVTPEEAIADAEVLGYRDMRAKYRELMAPEKTGDDPGPEEPSICETCGRPL